MATEAPKSLAEAINIVLKKIPKKITSNNIDTIFRVPRFITAKNERLYKPKMLPIGPYHHDKKKFKAIKEHKERFLLAFLERNKEVNLDTYIDTMHNLKDRARACYSETVFKSDDNKFVEVLLYDGCFILELLLKLEENKRHCHCWAGWDFMAILSDLLLIENQIPFFVLEELYTTAKKKTSQVQPDLKSLAVKNLFVTYLGASNHSSWVKGPRNNEIYHLLHLYHEVSLPHPDKKKVFGNTMADNKVQRTENHRLPVVIPPATKLMEFGFELTKQDSRNISDVTMKHSTIKIPRLIIDSTRRTILMNLLAFEQGLEESKRRWTGLMVMMNCMIKNKSDLDILQSSGIVVNLLPSDDEAVEFFRQLSKRVTIEFNDHYYSDLFEQVHESSEAYFRQRRAAFMHEYFNNRWAVISFCSSIIAIFLSTVQTLVSVFTYSRRYL